MRRAAGDRAAVLRLTRRSRYPKSIDRGASVDAAAPSTSPQLQPQPLPAPALPPMAPSWMARTCASPKLTLSAAGHRRVRELDTLVRRHRAAARPERERRHHDHRHRDPTHQRLHALRHGVSPSSETPTAPVVPPLQSTFCPANRIKTATGLQKSILKEMDRKPGSAPIQHERYPRLTGGCRRRPRARSRPRGSSACRRVEASGCRRRPPRRRCRRSTRIADSGDRCTS